LRHGSTRKAKVRTLIPATDRVREFRARAKRNVMLVTIEVPKDLPDALLESGFLKEWDAENPQEIRKAIERVLAQLLAT
jgi:hypothetical protein